MTERSHAHPEPTSPEHSSPRISAQDEVSTDTALAAPVLADAPLGSTADAAGDELAHNPAKNPAKDEVLRNDFRQASQFSGRFILIIAALAVAGYLLKYIWTGLLPVLLALLVTTVMFPVAVRLRLKLSFPPALAAATTLLGFFAIISGIFSALAPTVRSQGADLFKQAESGLGELIKLIENLPFNIQADRLQKAIDDLTGMLKGQASNIAGGVISGVSTASTVVLTVVIMFFLTFFMLKDGDRFLPWLRRYTGVAAGWHITELSSRIWRTLSGFIQAQATVAAVDAILIGLGLWALGVPLAFAIGVVTFFASFIPLIGAIVAGALAVIIALVSNGLTNALLALLLVVVVQQIEGHVLQPMLQSKAMGLHATIVLLSVTVGSALAGIVGAFLAVPIAATIAVIIRYHADITNLRAGHTAPEDVDIATGRKMRPEDRENVRALYESLAPSHQRA